MKSWQLLGNSYLCPKTLVTAYDLAIDWNADTKGSNVAPNNGISFTMETTEGDIHATDWKNMTLPEKLVFCHICGKKNYGNSCP